MEISYAITYGGLTVQVRTTILLDGEFEARLHRVIAPDEIDPSMELAEGSAALGLQAQADADHSASDRYTIVRSRQSGMLIGSWPGEGWSGSGAAWDFGTAESSASNVIYPAMQVNTLWTKVKPGVQILAGVHYASPKPLAASVLHATAAKLQAKLRAMRVG
jgi:hypothetical protein